MFGEFSTYKSIHGLCDVDLASEAVTGGASGTGPLVVCIPLSVKIIRHVYNVVHNLGNSVDGEVSQIPVGGWGSDGHGMVWKLRLEDLQESGVVSTLVYLGSWGAGDIISL